MSRSKQPSPDNLPPYIQKVVDEAVDQQRSRNGVDARDDFERRAKKLYEIAHSKGRVANVTKYIRAALEEVIDEAALDEGAIRRRKDRSHGRRKPLSGEFNGAWEDGVRALEESGTMED